MDVKYYSMAQYLISKGYNLTGMKEDATIESVAKKLYERDLKAKENEQKEEKQPSMRSWHVPKDEIPD